MCCGFTRQNAEDFKNVRAGLRNLESAVCKLYFDVLVVHTKCFPKYPLLNFCKCAGYTWAIATKL